MSVLLGTQAECVHSPPSLCFSTSATFAPTRAAAEATFRPPAPPPRTTRSYMVRFVESGRLSVVSEDSAIYTLACPLATCHLEYDRPGTECLSRPSRGR